MHVQMRLITEEEDRESTREAGFVSSYRDAAVHDDYLLFPYFLGFFLHFKLDGLSLNLTKESKQDNLRTSDLNLQFFTRLSDK